jgi:hypothetical protein
MFSVIDIPKVFLEYRYFLLFLNFQAILHDSLLFTHYFAE